MAFLRTLQLNVFSHNPAGEYCGDSRLFKKSPKAPAAPDPKETAAAQTASNKETAYWNAVLNNVNQVTPYGNLSYQQTGGGKTYNDAAYNTALDAYSRNLSQASQRYTTQNGKRIDNPYYNPNYAKRVKAPDRNSYITSDAPPSFTSTINLSPEQQALYDTQTRSEQGLASLGEEQLGRIRQSVSSPYSYGGIGDAFTAEDATAASQRGEEALMARLNPQFARDEEALRTRLINQGIGQGSEAYNREFERFGQTQNDARMQAVLQGANYGGALQQQSLQRRNQGISEYDAQRNAPLNEYIGLTSGVQVQNPQFSSQGYNGAGQVDYAGLVNQNYQNQMAQYNAKVAGNNSTMGSLFGLGGNLLGATAGTGAAGSAGWLAMLSDIRAKENIERIGTTPGGLGVYEYNYIGNDTPQTGVIAQEVELINPDAVVTGDDGLKRVYYHMVR